MLARELGSARGL